MFLKFKDRTWILLGKLVDKGLKEGNIKHIEIPLKEWKMLREEYADLPKEEQKKYINRFKIETVDKLRLITPELVMDEDFVDKWVEGEYTIHYRGAKLIPECPEWTVEEEEKAKADIETS